MKFSKLASVIIVSFLLPIVLMHLILINNYYHSIFNPGIDLKHKIDLHTFSILQFLNIAILSSVFFSTLFHVKELSRNKNFSVSHFIKKASPIIILLSILLALINNFFAPNNHLKFVKKLYNFEQTNDKNPLNELSSDFNYIFENSPSNNSNKKISQTILILNNKIDSTKLQILDIINTLPDTLSSNISYNDINQIIETIANVKKSSLTKTQLKNIRKIEYSIDKINKYKKKKSSFQISIFNRFSQIIELIILFLFACLFGYIYFDQNNFLLFILGMNTLPSIHGLTNMFQNEYDKILTLNQIIIIKGIIIILVFLIFTRYAYLKRRNTK
jgi:hypothetical protein